MTRLIEDLIELTRAQDRATLAALRRGLGKPPGSAGEMYPFVIPRLPPATQAGWTWEQQCYFIVASLYAWHPAATRERTFGDSARWLREALAGADGPERRFVALLNAGHEDLPHHLRGMVGLFRANDIPVDWSRLLGDLVRWNDPERPVQISWARSFWRALPDDGETNADREEGAVTD